MGNHSDGALFQTRELYSTFQLFRPPLGRLSQPRSAISRFVPVHQPHNFGGKANASLQAFGTTSPILEM